jgi:hypothetical protein
MTKKKAYPCVVQKPQPPLAKGVKRRIRLMQNHEPVERKNQGKEEREPSVLEQIVREGARKLLQAAIEEEVASYIALFSEIRDDQGRRLIVRNGFLPQRSIQTGIGPIPVKQPRVRVEPHNMFC